MDPWIHRHCKFNKLSVMTGHFIPYITLHFKSPPQVAAESQEEGAIEVQPSKTSPLPTSLECATPTDESAVLREETSKGEVLPIASGMIGPEEIIVS